MAIVVETGIAQRSPPANSYVAADEFRTFYENRGDTVIAETAEDEVLEAALISGADYMQQRLRMLWKGSRVWADQPLDWPREGVDVPDFFDPFYRNVNVPVSFRDTYFVPENVIPPEVKQCQMYLARQLVDSLGALTGSDLQTTLGRVTKSEAVGSLKVEYFGAEDASDGGRQTEYYYNAMRIVEPYLLASAPQTGRVVRS